jgi:hypothetical protein
MKVIGAGLPRTATTTQMVVLEQLGLAPCYHMRDLLADLPKGLPLWEAAAAGNAKSTVDWPSARYYRELMDYYPDAKVLLSVRDGESWVRSMRETVWGIFHGDSVLHYASAARTVVDPLWRRYIKLMNGMNWDEETGVLAGDTYSDEGLAAIMDRWNEEVRGAVPAERLIEWYPSDGWESLCERLGVDVPADPIPHLNDTASFKEGIIGGALGVLNQWWDARERPASGLHGAALD